MKIEIADTSPKIQLHALHQGSVFTYNGETCMLTDRVLDTDGFYINAVNLETGKLLYLENDLYVSPKIDAKVVI